MSIHCPNCLMYSKDLDIITDDMSSELCECTEEEINWSYELKRKRNSEALERYKNETNNINS